MNGVWNPSGLIVRDDGTNVLVSYGTTKLFRMVKSTGNLQVAGGFDSDTSL